MDRVEYNLKAEQIKNLVRNRELEAAMDVCDSVDWRRVKSLSMLCTVSEIYKANKRLEDSRDVLLMAYDRYPNNKMIVYSLCELAIKINDILQALAYLKEFVNIAPKDTGRYILQYKLYTAQNVRIEERIEVLEHYKAEEYREKWAYELAYLYHSIGDATKCVEECDELILWFREGKYVEMAMELKMSHQPLSPDQLKNYQRMTGIGEEYFDESEEAAYEDEAAYQDYDMPSINIKSVAPSSQRTQEILMKEETPDLDIKLREFNQGKDSTINIQAALSESVSDLFADRQDDSYGMQLEPVDASQEVYYPEEQYADSDVQEYQQEYPEEYAQNYPQEVSAEYPQEQYSQEEYPQEEYSQESQESALGYPSEYPQPSFQPEYQKTINHFAEEIPSEEEEDIPAAEEFEADEFAAEEPAVEEPAAEEPIAEEPVAEEPEAEEPEAEEPAAEEPVAEEPAAEEPAVEEPKAEESGEPVVQAQEVRPVAPKVPKRPIDPSIKPIIPRAKKPAMRQDMGMEVAGKSMNYASAGPALESMGKSMPSAGKGVSRDTVGMSHILSQEYDGQISMVVPEPDPIEKQITGQIDINQYLKEWDALRQQNTRSRIDAAKRKSMEQTSDIMSQLEGVLPGISTPLPPIEEISRGVQLKKREEEELAAAAKIAEEAEAAEAAKAAEEAANAETDAPAVEKEPALVSQNTGILDDIPMGETGALPFVGEDEELYEDENDTSGEETYEDESEYSEEDDYYEEEDYPEEGEYSDEEYADEDEYSEDEEEYPEDADEYPEEDEYAEDDEPSDESGEGDESDEYESESDESDDGDDSDEVEETVDLSDDENSPNVYEDLSEEDEEDEEDSAEEDAEVYESEDDELEEFFGEFLQMKKMRSKIKEALAASDMTAVINNIVITGNEKSARLKLALAIARSKQKSEPDFTGKVAKVSAKVLNTKDVKKAVASLAGGAMIIESAGDLDPNTLERLARSLNHRSSRMLVIMEDEYDQIRALSMTKPYFSKMFNVSLKMSAFKNDDLVAHAKAYALDQEYVIDDLAVLALYTRIDDLQTHNHFVTLSEVEEIIDEAIDKANRKNFSHFKDVLFAKRYDENDMVILREKDFEE